ncbi:MAG: hypothetical protein WBC05_10750 [Sedimentisphaerales bacterium]
MRSRSNYPIQVLAAGFLVLMFLSLSLFWARWVFKSILADIMPMDYRSVEITPSGLVPSEIESDQYVPGHSGVHAYISDPQALQALGIPNYLSDKAPEERHSGIYYLELEGENSSWIYFDERIGQINCRWADVEKMPDGTVKRKKVQFYAGPEGVSEIPDNKLGKFTSVVADIDLTSPILYDKNLRRFFAINIKDRKVTKGPQLSKDDPRQPVDIGMLSKNPDVLDLYWLPPTSQNHKGGVSFSRGGQVLIREGFSEYEPDRYVLVLDKSGRIDLLDKKTLEFAGPAGRLPAPETFFPADKNVTPDDLLAYRVLPLALKEDHKYRGLFAAAVSREGTALALAVFDEKGACIRIKDTRARDSRGRRNEPSSSAVFFGAPWAPVMTISKFLLENLHPPILSLASFFTAGSIEAASGHRAMFLLPNSFVAMKGRDARGNIALRFLSALALISPSIILAILLAWRIGRDAAIVGLPRKTRRFWTLGTIAFGLVGYITYRLTRPKITLVTCVNCGKPRRPDMEKCHRCGSKWDVPELTPPVWRVLNRTE